MKQMRRKKGFTMAEMLIVVAIIIVLAGVSFVGIFRYQRTLHQLEMDNIAREIYVAAQNHLTMADSQGLVQKKVPGTQEPASLHDEKLKDDVYYFVVGADASYPRSDGTSASVLDLMLPLAAVDETVRLGGSYVIRYQLSEAKILDVFYANKTGRYSHTFTTDENEYKALLNAAPENGYYGPDCKENRRKYKFGADQNAVIGFCGEEEANAIQTGDALKMPTIEVINAERLTVKISNPNKENDLAGLQLIVTGKTSTKSHIIDLIKSTGALPSGSEKNYSDDKDNIDPNVNKKTSFTVVLDDVTSADDHFVDVCGTDGLIPGEDIIIQAKAYNNQQLTNIAYSSGVDTNSLFASVSPDETLKLKSSTAEIVNFRHLENLSPAISEVNSGTADVIVTKAQQNADMDWHKFMAAITGKKVDDPDYDKVSIYTKKEGLDAQSKTAEGYYMPVNPDQQLIYESKQEDTDAQPTIHTISNVKINTSDTNGAGLFGTLLSGSRVNNLKLEAFDIGGTGTAAGTLAGTVTNTTITNVLAYGANSTVTGTTAGGLVGVVNGGSETNNKSVVKNCAAAVYVNASSGDAGGLIGKATGTVNVMASYSGGHTAYILDENDRTKATKGGYYSTETDEAAAGHINVQTSGIAGGLIGDASGATLDAEYCYSTSSVRGSTVGGFAGKVNNGANNKIMYSYATGLVEGTAENAKKGIFIGEVGDTGQIGSLTLKKNYYYDIVNNGDAPTDPVPAIGGGINTTEIIAFDQNLTEYNNFVLISSDNAIPFAYDPYVTDHCGGKYDLRTVSGLYKWTDATPSDPIPEWLTKHYGDWPMPETFVINTSN